MTRRTRRIRAGLIAAVIAVVLAGCGADQNGDQITAPLAVTSTTHQRVPTSAIQAPTGTTTSTTPSTTTVTTTPESSLPGYRKPNVLLGDMNTPEQFVLGQLYAYALRAKGYTVAVSRNIGPPSVAQEALREGSLFVYPDYLDDFNQQVAGIDRSFTTVQEAYDAAEGYASKHGMVLLQPTPFSDTSALAVTSAFAHSLHITSIPELANGPGVIIGAPLQFIDAANGLPALEHAYGLKPSLVQQVPLGDQYGDLDNNVIQAAYVQSTDPQLEGPRYVALADPLHVTGIGNVVPVTTTKVLAEEGPAFAQTLNRVDALLTASAIRGLNAEVQLNHADPGQAAFEFLQANGMLPTTSTTP